MPWSQEETEQVAKRYGYAAAQNAADDVRMSHPDWEIDGDQFRDEVESIAREEGPHLGGFEPIGHDIDAAPDPEAAWDAFDEGVEEGLARWLGTHDKRVNPRKKALPGVRWLSRATLVNLREVAPRLYVGGEGSPVYCRSERIDTVVELAGMSFDDRTNEMRLRVYDRLARHLRWPFDDGQKFPAGCLAAVCGLATGGLVRGKVLIHCAAGISRAGSAGYAVLRVVFGLSHAEAARRALDPTIPPSSRTFRSAVDWVKVHGRHFSVHKVSR